ncbi:hypothetical protein B0T26DRAFT_750050 [Lasiosphaeria miniovina]|uniref:Zn(2)-C6 fungal-type domain-containing protein n=1 Tax=Lasiosphaeria miniovina TaxID=1954250 RepID=A0AA40AVB4_9PEZI|nr:uncharacterized protein B0T26DRAFT_750050 [Lasiosphaeria miniovina]KAK0722683.1 hypothetical protein B0T26DRAFT_750050 [Lasiosphaeria miniovina]
MDKRKARDSAPYGKACLNCVKTKCKCIPRADGNDCERCHRLKKQCHPSDGHRRRTTHNHAGSTNSNARITELEDRLSSLVSLLESRGQTATLTQSEAQTQLQPQAQPGPLSALTPARLPQSARQQPSASPRPRQQSRPRPKTCIYGDILGALHVGFGGRNKDDDNNTDNESETSSDCGYDHGQEHDAADDDDDSDADTVRPETQKTSAPFYFSLDPIMNQVASATGMVSNEALQVHTDYALVDLFRSGFLPQLPFIHMSVDLASQLIVRSERPLLLRAIACVTAPTTLERRTRATELKSMFCEVAFLQRPETRPDIVDQKMDLLLGLLTYIAWGWDHDPAVSRLMAVAASLAGELHLADEPGPRDMHALRYLAAGFQNPPAAHVTPQVASERRRAVLSCFVLSSAVASYYGQPRALPWTDSLEEALAAIAAGNESREDAVLVLQVHLQLLAAKAGRLHAELGNDVNVLLQQTQGLRACLPPGLGQEQEAILIAHTHHTELSILLSPSSQQQQSGDDDNGLARAWNSAQAIERCTTALLSLPATTIPHLTLVQWTQLAHCFAALHRLDKATIPAPVADSSDDDDQQAQTWDVRSTVDLADVLRRAADTLERTAREAGELVPPPGAGAEVEDGVLFSWLARGVRTFCGGVERDRVGGRVAMEGGGDEENHEMMMGLSLNGQAAEGPPLTWSPPQKGFFWKRWA